MNQYIFLSNSREYLSSDGGHEININDTVRSKILAKRLEPTRYITQ